MSNLEKIVDELSKLTVIEAAELAKKLEEKWGVSAAAAPVAVAVAPGAASAEGASAAKTEFDVHLVSFDASSKLNIIKEVRALTALGLKEAKDLVEAAPKVLKSGVSKDEADKMKKTLEAAGAKVDIK